MFLGTFISVSPKLNFAGSQVVTLLNLCDPLEGFQQKWCKKLSQGQIRKTNGEVTSGFFKSSRLWIKGLFVSNHLWQTWIKKNPSLQSPPDLRFSYKLRTFSRNPGKVRSEGIVSPGDPDILGPRKLMNKTYLIWNICRHQVDESCSG